jgi:hypothetical protein
MLTTEILQLFHLSRFYSALLQDGATAFFTTLIKKARSENLIKIHLVGF